MPDLLGFAWYQPIFQEKVRLTGGGDPAPLEAAAARLHSAADALARHDVDLSDTATRFARSEMRGETADAYLVAHGRRVRHARRLWSHLTRDSEGVMLAAESIARAQTETANLTRHYLDDAATITRAFNNLPSTVRKQALPAYREAARDLIETTDARLSEVTRRLRSELATAATRLHQPGSTSIAQPQPAQTSADSPALQVEASATTTAGPDGSTSTLDEKVTVPIGSWDGAAGDGQTSVFSSRRVEIGADGSGTQTDEHGVVVSHSVPLYTNPETGDSVTASGQGTLTEQSTGSDDKGDVNSTGITFETGVQGTFPGYDRAINFAVTGSGEAREDVDPSGEVGAEALGAARLTPTMGVVGTGSTTVPGSGDPTYQVGAGVGYDGSGGGVAVQRSYGTDENGTDPQSVVMLGGYVKPADEVTLRGSAEIADTTTVRGGVTYTGDGYVIDGAASVDLDDGTTEATLKATIGESPGGPATTWQPGEEVPLSSEDPPAVKEAE
jgi:hypothetical protein